MGWGGEDSSLGCKWPGNKAKSQASVEGSGWIVCKHAMNADPRRQVSLGHVPKILKSRQEASMVYWDRRHPLCWYGRGGVQSQWQRASIASDS
jgi:hypothetical protein